MLRDFSSFAVLIKHNCCAATVAPVDHADRVLEIRISNPSVTLFLIKSFLTTVAPVDHADRVWG
ncbi:MAG: hypothetical protein PHG79_02915 [Methanosarcina sp.]|nr:hypothetical protein [Methanosarcina sp.]MDD3872650.1 hypothetical protein [Methanosarcina sp.]